MARPKSVTLTSAELRLMDVLWRRGKSTVAEVADALDGPEKLAYSSVLTTLRILEQKGYVRHEQSGRAFVYEPSVDQSSVRKSALGHLLGRLFEGDVRLLMQNLADVEQLDDEDRAAIKRVLGKGEKVKGAGR